MAYKVLRATTLEALEAEVNAFIAAGWIKTGGFSAVPIRAKQVIILVNVAELEYELLYFQAVSKEDV